jgi:hypothetical protein
MEGDVIGGEDIGFDGAGDEAGIDRSSRSFIPDAGAAGFEGAGDENAEKPPKPLDVVGL